MQVVAAVKRALPDVDLIAGNVATYEGARDLIALGVDGIKVGIGPGSICTTRVVSGAGVPQITAIAECAQAARGAGVPHHRRRRHQVFGRRHQGHRRRRRLRHDRKPVRRHRRKPRRDDSLSGPHLQELPRHGFARAPWRRAPATATRKTAGGKLVPEGIEGRVPYKGMVAETGVPVGRRDQSRHGLLRLPRPSRELQEKARFLRVTSAGLRESHVHDVIITKEAPNYRLE